MADRTRAYISLLLVVITTLFISIASNDAPRSFANNFYEFQERITAKPLGFSSIKALLGFSLEPSLSETVKNDLSGVLKKTLTISWIDIFKSRFFHNSDIPVLYIDIPFKSLSKLKQERVAALNNGILEKKTWVKAEITTSGKKYKTEVRLKGDLSDHWRTTTRYSLSVKMKKKDSLFGYSRFAIQKPSSRQYPYSPILSSLVASEGLLSSDHSQVKVFVNGEDWGVMDLEERLSSEFLEKKQRKDAPVISFGLDRALLNRKEADNFYGLENFYIDIEHVKKDTNYSNTFGWIVNDFYNNSRGNLTVDREQLVKAIAITLLWGNAHHLYPINVKYYLNPYSFLLEPIIGDTDPPRQIVSFDDIKRLISEISCLCNETQRAQLLIDALNLLTTNKGDQLLIIAKNQSEEVKKIFPSDASYDLSPLEENLNYFKEFNPGDLIIDQIPKQNQDIRITDYVNSEKIMEADDVTVIRWQDNKISIVNNTPLPITMSNLVTNIGRKLLDKPLRLEPSTSITHTSIMTSLDSYVDSDEKRFSMVLNGQTVNANFDQPILNRPQIFKDTIDYCPHNMINTEEESLLSGQILIDQPIIYKSGLIIREGTNIVLGENGSMLICGTFQSLGSSELPVIINGLVGNKGIHVIANKSRVDLRETKISNLGVFSNRLINLTGALNLYNGMISIRNVSINNANSEDALNIIQSDVNINGLEISDTISDAIDFDFVNGDISNIKLSNIGGDALDFSGSVVDISKVRCLQINDKCISGGEASTINIFGLKAINSGVAIASKDGSKVFADNVDTNSINLAPALAYNKKSFYDPASLRIENLISDTESSGSQGNSVLVINGKIIDKKYTSAQIEEEYKSGAMKK